MLQAPPTGWNLPSMALLRMDTLANRDFQLLFLAPREQLLQLGAAMDGSNRLPLIHVDDLVGAGFRCV